MDAAIAECIARLHQQPVRWALVLTGGGIRLGGWLLSVPGGSRTILELQNPYDVAATDGYLGRPPRSYCAVETAVLLAERARERARWLAPRESVAGFGCTASLRTDRPRRGDHRVHLATATDAGTRTWSLTLTRDARSRDDEDDLAARLGLLALTATLGLPAPVLPLLANERVEESPISSPEPLVRFLTGAAEKLCLLADGREQREAAPPRALVPGSFNPLHEGHLALARLASERVGAPAGFEISVANVEKPPLTAPEIRWRQAQFRWRAPLWLSKAPRFVEKARLFPGVLFAVGADTARRLVEPRFYDDDPQRMAAALEEIRRLGCRFLVAGRVDAAGGFQGLEQLAIPEAFRDLFEGVPENAFRLDLSSTDLRRKSG